MPIKLNYKIIGFVRYSDYKKLYNQLMDYRQKNAIKNPLSTEKFT